MTAPEPPNSHVRHSRRRFLLRGLHAAASAGSGLGLMAMLGCRRLQQNRLTSGMVRIALDADVETLDPAMHRSRTVEAVVRNVCDSLVTCDQQMRYFPQLASSWRIERETRWIFSLRKGVRFHNGDAFTAEDVKFSLDRILNRLPGLPPSTPACSTNSSAQATSADTVHTGRTRNKAPRCSRRARRVRPRRAEGCPR